MSTCARLVVLLSAALLGGCAGTGATLGSGVGDRMLDSPPWVAGGAVPDVRIVHLPVRFQAGAIHPESFDPSAAEGSPVAGLLGDLTAHLARIGASIPAPSASPLPGVPPDVHFGCLEAGADECDPDEEPGGLGSRRRMRLAVGRPSPEWTAALGSLLDETGADAALVVTLEVGEYWTRQRDLLGRKEVLLGVGRAQDLPWLTSLDQPVQVLQLTAALVGRDGKAIRIGAEGLLARRTPIVLSGFGVQELLTDEDVAEVRERTVAPRGAGSGDPRPVWEVALERLVAGVTGRP